MVPTVTTLGAHVLIDAHSGAVATSYELLAGEPPFSDDVRSMLDGRLSRHPAAIGEHRPEAGTGLCDLVSRLLDKEPAARPVSAAEVEARLLADTVPRPLPVARRGTRGPERVAAGYRRRRRTFAASARRMTGVGSIASALVVAAWALLQGAGVAAVVRRMTNVDPRASG
jgi:hypothetical protein